MKEDKKLKRFLVLQSLCPLFLLVFIKHVGRSNLIIRFMTPIFHGDWTVGSRKSNNESSSWRCDYHTNQRSLVPYHSHRSHRGLVLPIF